MSEIRRDTVQHTWVTGNDLRRLLQEQIRLHTEGTVRELSELHGQHTVTKLHHLIRSVEELINIEEAAAGKDNLDRALDAEVDRVLVDDSLEGFSAALHQHYHADVCERVTGLLPRVGPLRASLLLYRGDADGRFSNLRTPRDLAFYFKSRRRHLNTLFYTVSDVCVGDKKLNDEELFRAIFCIIDYTLVALTGMHQKLAMLELFADYGCWHTGNGLLDGSEHWQELLDRNYLEPERVAITDVPLQMVDLSAFDHRKIISAAELREMLIQIEKSYQEFDLADKGFSDLSFFIVELLPYTKDDYFVRVPQDAYQAIAGRYKHAWWMLSVVYQANPAHPFLGSFSPMVQIGGLHESDLLLLLRFAYDIRARALETHRRYQIRSGFLFEDVVKHELVRLGFDVLKIKRIQRKEFDVVATRGGAIHNFQCKNVRLDYRRMETDLGMFVRHNKRIVSYFKRALHKEEAREALLTKEIGLDEIHHYVISRFPVFSDSERILSLRDLDRALSAD